MWDNYPMQSIHVRLDDDFHAELKAEASRRKLSVQEVAQVALVVALGKMKAAAKRRTPKEPR